MSQISRQHRNVRFECQQETQVQLYIQLYIQWVKQSRATFAYWYTQTGLCSLTEGRAERKGRTFPRRSRSGTFALCQRIYWGGWRSPTCEEKTLVFANDVEHAFLRLRNRTFHVFLSSDSCWFSKHLTQEIQFVFDGSFKPSVFKFKRNLAFHATLISVGQHSTVVKRIESRTRTFNAFWCFWNIGAISCPQFW